MLDERSGALSIRAPLVTMVALLGVSELDRDSLILGQCTQRLKDKMKQDADWTVVSTSNDPLQLIALIEKTILAQTEDQYPFATVYEQEQGFYSYRQENLSNAQWYERFNTKVDVSNSIGVTRQHKALLEWSSKELHDTTFNNLTDIQKSQVKEDATLPKDEREGLATMLDERSGALSIRAPLVTMVALL